MYIKQLGGAVLPKVFQNGFRSTKEAGARAGFGGAAALPNRPKATFLLVALLKCSTSLH